MSRKSYKAIKTERTQVIALTKPEHCHGYLVGRTPSTLDQVISNKNKFFEQALEGYTILWAEIEAYHSDIKYLAVLARMEPYDPSMPPYLFLTVTAYYGVNLLQEPPVNLFSSTDRQHDLTLEELPSVLVGDVPERLVEIVMAEIASAKDGPPRIDDVVADDLFDALVEG